MLNAPIQQPTFFNQKYLLDTIDGLLAEIARNHRQLPNCPGKFHNGQIEITYRRLGEIRKVIDEHKETEWYLLTERIRKKEASKGVQSAIF